MQFEWLNRENNKNLIVFFNGWGSIKPKMNYNGCDVIMLHNYTSFEKIDIDFSLYGKKYLIAWSLGVFVCNFYFDVLKNFDGYTAINGTFKPVDDNFGIPVTAYDLTINNFNELTCKKFIKKTGANSEIIRNIEDLKQELIEIKNLKPDNFINFDKVILSTNDRIFPYKNMKAYWEDKDVNITEIEAPHYLFDYYKNWSDLI